MLHYNIEAFVELREKYMSLLLMPDERLAALQIESSYAETIDDMMGNVTGFDDRTTCTLCAASVAIMKELDRETWMDYPRHAYCRFCLWNYPHKQTETACSRFAGFDDIQGAQTFDELRHGLRRRIQAMDRKIKSYYKDQQNENKEASN